MKNRYEDIEEEYEYLKVSIHTAAEETFGKIGVVHIWWTEEIKGEVKGKK